MPEPGSTCSSQPAGNGSPCWGGSSSLGSSHGSDPGPTRAGYMSVLWLRRQRGGKCDPRESPRSERSSRETELLGFVTTKSSLKITFA
jgi:hypothetical protein